MFLLFSFPFLFLFFLASRFSAWAESIRHLFSYASFLNFSCFFFFFLSFFNGDYLIEKMDSASDSDGFIFYLVRENLFFETI